jgi:hypothetical protein
MIAASTGLVRDGGHHMSAMSADRIAAGPQDHGSQEPGGRAMTAPAPACGGFSAREECTALAQAITIRARVKLVQAYACLYESWMAEDQIKRDEARQTQPGAQPAGLGNPPGRPAAGRHTISTPPERTDPRSRRKAWSSLRRWIR